MESRYLHHAWGAAALALMASISAPANAITINVDGSNFTTLSAAVTAAYAANDGPDVINLGVDSLPTADGQIVLDKPITINGDGESNGVGNGTPCDILVDMTGIMGAADIGQTGKSYLEVLVTGDVNISNLKIHPNADGAFSDNSLNDIVSGIRVFKPVGLSDITNLTLTRVFVSGSDSSNAYVPLDSGADLYNQPGIKRWGGLSTQNDGGVAAHGAFHFSNALAGGAANTTLDHCHFGLTKALAAAIPGEGGSVTILGGVYGHCARDAIRVSGENVTIKGTATDRVRIVRSTNVSAANSHGIEVVAGGTIPLMEYVDIAGCNTANSLSLRDGHVSEINNVRAMGKFTPPTANNEQAFFSTAGNTVDLVRNTTIVGMGDPNNNPLNIVAAVVNPIEFRDCIFTSLSTTATVVLNCAATITFNNCALPSDGTPNESLANPPISGTNVPVQNGTVSASPQYLLTLADYDWSDSQGSGNVLNGAGNHNVLRPALSNTAYLTASSTGGRLTGGAGPDVASVADWELF